MVERAHIVLNSIQVTEGPRSWPLKGSNMARINSLNKQSTGNASIITPSMEPITIIKETPHNTH